MRVVLTLSLLALYPFAAPAHADSASRARAALAMAEARKAPKPAPAACCECCPACRCDPCLCGRRLAHAGHSWTWAAGRYVPDGEGWNFDAESGCWWRPAATLAAAAAPNPHPVQAHVGAAFGPIRGAAC